MVHHQRGPRGGQNDFLESTRDRRIKDREECRKVIEEEMEESQTDSHHVQAVYILNSQND